MHIRTLTASWLGRQLLMSGGHLNLTRVPVLGKRVLIPLRRHGLDPIPDLACRPPVSRLHLLPGVRAWLITGNDECRAVLGARDGFSNDFTHLASNFGLEDARHPGGLAFADPPHHTRLRRLLTPEFTVRRLARLAPRIEEIVAGRLNAMAAMPAPVDLWQEFALPIPTLVLCELLGVPYADHDNFQRLATARFVANFGGSASLGAISESLEYFNQLARRRREEPGADLLGMIIREHGDEMSDAELAGLADGVLSGGLETTACMLALGTLVLLQNPAAVRQALGPSSAVDDLVEELLRYLTVGQMAFPRFATRDLELSGQRICAGDMLLCSLSGANSNVEPKGFDAERKVSAHLAFGHGIHRCIGAELARMELRCAYPALLRRFPALRLAVPPAKLAFRSASFVYGVDALPVLLH